MARKNFRRIGYRMGIRDCGALSVGQAGLNRRGQKRNGHPTKVAVSPSRAGSVVARPFLAVPAAGIEAVGAGILDRLFRLGAG